MKLNTLTRACDRREEALAPSSADLGAARLNGTTKLLALLFLFWLVVLLVYITAVFTYCVYVVA